MAMEFRETKLSRAPDRSAITHLIDYQGFCGGPNTAPPPPPPAPNASNGRTMDEVEAESGGDAGPKFYELTPSQCYEKLTHGWTPWVLGWHLPYAASLAAFVFMGISMAESVLCWALAKELNPPSLSGTATSLVNAGGFLGVALLQPLVGWIVDRSAGSPALEGYRMAAGLLALVALVGVIAAFRLRETRCRNVYAELRGT